MAKVYDSPSYDYSNLTETLSDSAASALQTVQALSPTHQASQTAQNAPAAQPKTLPHALARAAQDAQMALYPGALKGALEAYKAGMDRTAAARLAQDTSIQEDFTTPWAATLQTSIAQANKSRAAVRTARLFLDGAKQTSLLFCRLIVDVRLMDL